MKICGIIVEYNPFHNGHLYHAEMARKQTGADIVIAVMSGNFLQRGEPAIVDKWVRAHSAVSNGVDLVIELPFEWAVQSADFFARGAVQLLSKVGCEAICFGSDVTEVFDYKAYGNFYRTNQQAIDEELQKIADPSLTYAQKMIQVLKKLQPSLLFNENQPNHILALSYAKENAMLSQPMELVSISRKAAGYHSTDLAKGGIASATAIRKALGEQTPIDRFVPIETRQAVALSDVIDWEVFWLYLKYELIVQSVDSLQMIYQMVDGLEYRLKKFVATTDSFSEFLDSVQSKRYTRTRIQRLCVYVLLHVTKEEMQKQQLNQMIRPLAYTKKGLKHIRNLQKKSIIITSRFGKKQAEDFPITLKADRVYQMANHSIEEQNFGRFVQVTD